MKCVDCTCTVGGTGKRKRQNYIYTCVIDGRQFNLPHRNRIHINIVRQRELGCVATRMSKSMWVHVLTVDEIKTIRCETREGEREDVPRRKQRCKPEATAQQRPNYLRVRTKLWWIWLRYVHCVTSTWNWMWRIVQRSSKSTEHFICSKKMNTTRYDRR